MVMTVILILVAIQRRLPIAEVTGSIPTLSGYFLAEAKNKVHEDRCFGIR